MRCQHIKQIILAAISTLAALLLAGVVISALNLGAPRTVTLVTTAGATTGAGKVTTTCSPAANQENPLMTFRIRVEYNRPWNATAIGYSNTTANQALLKCFSGNGNGWILISDWNPNGEAILKVTVQKMDSSSGNLTAVGTSGQVKSTVAPYGAVTISNTAVP